MLALVKSNISWNGQSKHFCCKHSNAVAGHLTLKPQLGRLSGHQLGTNKYCSLSETRGGNPSHLSASIVFNSFENQVIIEPWCIRADSKSGASVLVEELSY